MFSTTELFSPSIFTDEWAVKYQANLDEVTDADDIGPCPGCYAEVRYAFLAKHAQKCSPFQWMMLDEYREAAEAERRAS